MRCMRHPVTWFTCAKARCLRSLMRVVDAYLSFPYILIAIVWAALVGTDLKNLIIIVAVRGWVEFARVTRGQTLAIREREYITAVRGLGARDLRIVLRHILPNTLASILVVAGFQLGRAASLSNRWCAGRDRPSALAFRATR